MIGIELKNKKNVDKYVRLYSENKILVLKCGHDSKIIRILPPLNVNKKEVYKFIDISKKILN